METMGKTERKGENDIEPNESRTNPSESNDPVTERD